jgi:hypothetical protein
MTRRDAVSPELHDAVLRRDGYCFMARISITHVCHDRWGTWHPADDLSKLTVDHVHLDGGHVGRRAPSDLQHLVAMCALANIAGPSRSVREAEREYLRRLYDHE